MGSMKDQLGDTPYPAPDLFDLARGRALRDAGRDQVAGNNVLWMDGVMAFIRSLPVGWVGLLEDVRRGWKGDAPSHPNAWGSVASVAVRRGLLEETGVWRAASGEKSHARRMPEYRRRA